MNNIITLSQLITRLAKVTDTDNNTARRFVRAFFASIEEALARGETVSVKGIGTFRPNTDGTFNGDSPVLFIPDKSLAEEINAPFAMFEAVELAPTTVFPDDEEPAPDKEEAAEEETQQEEVREEAAQTTDETEPTVVETIVETVTKEPETHVIAETIYRREEPEPEPEEEAAPEAEQVRETTPETVPSKAPQQKTEPAKAVASPKKYRFPEEEEEEEETPAMVRRPQKRSSGSSMWLWVVIIILAGAAVGLLAAYLDPTEIEPPTGVTQEEVEQAMAFNEVGIEDLYADQAPEPEAKEPQAPAAEVTQPEPEPAPVSEVKAEAAPKSDEPVYDTVSSTLTALARKHYGKTSYWVYIFEANSSKLKNPNLVAPGTKVLIPAKETFEASTEAETVKKAKAKQAELNKKFPTK